MSKTKKYILLAATVWPLIYMVFFFVAIFSTFFLTFADQSETMPSLFFIIFPLHIFTMIEMFVLFVIYMLDILKGERVKKDDRVIWAIVILATSNVGMLIYWYKYIWNQPRTKRIKK